MGIEFNVSLAWGSPVQGTYYDLEDSIKVDPRFGLISTGCNMTGSPELVPFIYIKRCFKVLCSKYEYPTFNYFSFNDLEQPTSEEIHSFLQWRYDNGIKSILPLHGTETLTWHVIGSIS